MKPELFALGGVAVSSYGAILAFGVLLALGLFLSLARRAGGDADAMFAVALASLFSAWAGAKVFSLASLPPESWLTAFRSAGSTYGGLLGGTLGFLWMARRRRVPLDTTLRAALPSVPFLQGIVRIGCFAAGCCGGVPTALAWGIDFPGDHTHVMRHPVQLYDAALHLALVVLVLRLRASKMTTRGLFGVWAILEGGSRLFLETFRLDAGPRVAEFTLSGLGAVFLIVVGTAFLLSPRPIAPLG